MYSQTNKTHDKIQTMSYTSIGDPYNDPAKKSAVSSRFGGKQMQTNPTKKSGGSDVGAFDKNTYSADNYSDSKGYLKSQPPENRKMGFGSKDASKRDEFTTTIRTEQYRTQLNCEKNKVVKLPGDNQADSLSELLAQSDTPKKKTFLYDIGRKQNTEFDSKSSRDTYYVIGKPDAKGNFTRRLGPNAPASLTVGAGTVGLDHSTCRPQHGHVRATKTFLDKSSLGQTFL